MSPVAFVNRFDRAASIVLRHYGDARRVLMVNRHRVTLVGFYDAGGRLCPAGRLSADNDNGWRGWSA